MKSHPKICLRQVDAIKQRGVVLFIALIALVAMSLAAVALVRSVDTATIIAGNLAFKQSATTSADSGLERAVTWLSTQAAANAGKNLWSDATHTFNVTNAAAGYYSNVSAGLNLTADATWDAITATPAVIDTSGNTVQYIIQRMCRNPNQVISTTNCLFGSSAENNGESLAGELTLSSASVSTMYRITARVTGPKNTISYIQAFAY